MPTLMEGLKANLAKFRKEKGLSQEDLAEAIGTTRGTIAKYETGKGGATVNTIAKLAKTLGKEETELVSKLTTQDYKAFYELAVSVEAIKKENEELKSQLSDPLIQEVVSVFASLNDEYRRLALGALKSVARTAAASPTVGEKKAK